MASTPLQEFGLGFAGSCDQYGVVVVLPLWLPTLIAFVLAVIPYAVSGPWRFGLRTLLIFTTLVALILGLIQYFART